VERKVQLSGAGNEREKDFVGRLARRLFFSNRRGGPWPVPAHLQHEALTLPGNSGARLPARWFPHDRPRGAVVLAHPDRRYAQHWFVREGWVDFLHQAGFEVLTFDFPAYGRSEGGTTFFHEDLVTAARFAHQEAGGFPVHVVGVSLGAFVAANASPRLDFVEGLVLESPYPSNSAWFGSGPHYRLVKTLDALFPSAAAAFNAERNITKAAARRLLVAAATRDTITPVALTRAVAAAAPQDRTRYLEVTDVDHLGLFAGSSAYRQAVLETLGVPAAEAAALAASHPATESAPPHPAPSKGDVPARQQVPLEAV